MMRYTIHTSLRLLLLVSIVMTAGLQHARAQDGEVIDETRQVSANERITLDVMRGEVTIRTGSDNTFRVAGVLDEQAEGFELESGNGFTRFIVRMPRNMRGWNSQGDGSELDITVPAGSEVEFSGVNVNVDIDGVLGGARVTTVNGDINARNLAEFIALKTVNGSISSDNNQGVVSIETVNGEVRDDGSQGRLTVEAVNGEIGIDSSAEEVRLEFVNARIEVRLQSTRLLEFNGVNGEIDIHLTESAAPRIRGNSVSGEINLTVDPMTDARFHLHTNVGNRIENQLTSDEARRPQFGPGRSLQFTTGQGSGSVDINTVSGAIRVLVD